MWLKATLHKETPACSEQASLGAKSRTAIKTQYSTCSNLTVFAWHCNEECIHTTQERVEDSKN